jgi:uncharacterized surface anchored protein
LTTTTDFTLFNNLLPSTLSFSVQVVSGGAYDVTNQTLSTPVTPLYRGTGPSYFDFRVTSPGLLNNNIYDSWCLRAGIPIVPTIANATVYSSYGNVPAGVLANGASQTTSSTLSSLKQVNWVFNNVSETSNIVIGTYEGITTSKTGVNTVFLANSSQTVKSLPLYKYDLNQDGTIDLNSETLTLGDVQKAIWSLVGSVPGNVSLYDLGPYNPTRSNALVAVAISKGSDFIPTIGQDIGVIVSPGATSPVYQPTILEVKSTGVGDTIFLDSNGNGVADPGEGLSGVKVSLDASNNGTIDATTFTDSNGKYLFGPLPAGTYKVIVDTTTLPGGGLGFVNTVDPDGGNNGQSVVNLVGGTPNYDQDFGYRSTNLGDRVWSDTNRNGVQDSGEAGVSGVTVQLIASDGTTVLNTVTTDANGNYSFTNLAPGTYSIKLPTVPSAFSGFTSANQGGNTGTDSNILGGGQSAPVTLASGETNNSIDAGLLTKLFLGDRVWEDTNGNGIQDNGEAGIVGATVSLLNSNNNVIATTTTGNDGLYSFEVLPGTYSVQFSAPNGYSFTPANSGTDDSIDSDVVNGVTAPVTITTASDNTVDAGLYLPATLGDKVWSDTDRDGVQDSGEAGVSGVTVQLIASDGTTVLNTVTTDANGNYNFTNLAPGTYSIKVPTVPNSFSGFTSANQGGNTGTDSNILGGGQSAPVTLASGETNNTLDAGLLQKLFLGDRVWEDTNGNGVQDNAEAGIVGATVNLLDSNNNVIATTSTGNNGLYSFEVLPGTYSVQFSAPNGYSFAPANSGTDDSIDSDAVNGVTAPVTITTASDNTVDAGLYRPAALGDKVWSDTNRNGVQDNGEAGVSGVTVQLIASDGTTVLNTVTTDVNGNYNFTNLAPGTYSIKMPTVPAAFSGFTSANQGGNTSTDSNILGGGQSAPVTLASGETNNSIDAGLLTKLFLGDRVWEDTNGNGIQDNGEAGIVGATVSLLDSNNNVIATTTTGNDGLYSFEVLPGTYSVQFSAPNGYSFTPANSGTDDSIDSDAVNGVTAPVTITTASDNTVDAGLYLPATLGDKVWSDTDRDGVQDSGEAGVSGVTVQLIASDGTTVLNTVTTDANGNYNFTNLAPGTYSIKVPTVPNSFSGFTSANQGGNTSTDSNILGGGQSAPVTLASGETNNSIDAGLLTKLFLGDRVWEDTNGNGIQDNGEAGIVGATVSLLDSNNNVIATTTTGNDGLYSFEVLPGTYSVQFSAPNGYSFTPANSGTNDAIDSDAIGGVTAPVTITTTSDNTVDAGLYRQATLGDKVWSDTNRNGVQDNGEAGVGGVTVQLIAADGNTVLNTVTTDANGNYSFTNLAPGTYSIKLPTVPAAFSGFTSPNQGGNTGIDSNILGGGQSAPVTLASGETNNTLDAGLLAKLFLGDRVWEDTNGNGVQDNGEAGIVGATVSLLDSNNNVIATTSTGNDGLYSFEVLPGTYRAQFSAPNGYTFTSANSGTNDTIDSDAVNGVTAPVTITTTSDNTVDAGLYRPAALGDKVWSDTNRNGVQDSGEAGVSGVTVQLVAANGTTVLNTATTDANGNYNFTNLAPGTYSIKIPTVPNSFSSFTSPNQGGNTGTDSNILGGGQSAPVTLASGETNNTLDAGLLQKLFLGDRVWEDTNGNGVQDNGEAGIVGATVNLLDSNNNVIATTTTGNNGLYSFEVLPGTYRAQFSAPNGYTFTSANTGTNDTIDSDAVNGVTAPVTITTTSDNTVDAGLYRPAALGDKVWSDTNRNGVQDSGEAGVSGVTVQLVAANGTTVLNTATTDANGNYNFTNLAPGTYSIKVPTVPAAFSGFTSANQGGNTATDSNILGGGQSAPVTLASGETNNTVDAGLLPQSTPQVLLGDRVWSDTNGNGLQDNGEAGIVGATVNLLDSTSKVIATTTTGTNGAYNFQVSAGTYTVQFVSPNGYGFTTANAGNDRSIDSNADPLTGLTAPVAITNANNLTVDAGLYPRPSCLEGFTIGYWRNNGIRQNQWQVYATTDNYETVFGVGIPSATKTSADTNCDGRVTLLEALNVGGNSNSQNLLRQSTAALLNSAHSRVNYYYSRGEVITATRNAFLTTGTSDDNTLATAFDFYNNKEGNILA